MVDYSSVIKSIREIKSQLNNHKQALIYGLQHNKQRRDNNKKHVDDARDHNKEPDARYVEIIKDIDVMKRNKVYYDEHMIISISSQTFGEDMYDVRNVVIEYTFLLKRFDSLLEDLESGAQNADGSFNYTQYSDVYKYFKAIDKAYYEINRIFMNINDKSSKVEQSADCRARQEPQKEQTLIEKMYDFIKKTADVVYDYLAWRQEDYSLKKNL